MNYYSLCHEYLIDGFTDGNVKFSPALEDHYQTGRDFCFSNTSVSLIMDKKVKRLTSDFFLTTCGAFFMSEEMKEVVDDCKNQLVFIPAETKYFNGEITEKKYYFIHDSRKISCFDYFQSEYSGKALTIKNKQSGVLAKDHRVRGVKKFVVDASSSEGLDFLFVNNVIWIDPVVSELLVEKVKKHKLLVRFEPIG
ncbi:imm11 family protein [Pseudomonas sp. KNUC1026]|uniref:imm11 family protein n=1 Tax=Pseudomonas sp. KNUC1026 TaxID=2893890 RepID=UPI001F45B0A0|nr:DUF1629 domain-containing protein [Pseudomonas sp. KNUC1026]UFH48872.1 hypothetical protein LN139_18135 [Pseudomonas sp. KNUC1026]